MKTILIRGGWGKVLDREIQGATYSVCDPDFGSGKHSFVLVDQTEKHRIYRLDHSTWLSEFNPSD